MVEASNGVSEPPSQGVQLEENSGEPGFGEQESEQPIDLDSDDVTLNQAKKIRQ